MLVGNGFCLSLHRIIQLDFLCSLALHRLIFAADKNKLNQLKQSFYGDYS